jgi:hypothetical protein
MVAMRRRFYAGRALSGSGEGRRDPDQDPISDIENSSFTEEEMPTVSNANLNLTTVNNDVTVDVDFDVTFTAFERQLVALGLTFDYHIDVQGVDGATRTTLTSFSPTGIGVSVGAGSVIVPVADSITVSRASLQEDTGAGDNDEISCKIRVHAQGLPPTFTSDVFTNQRVLVG